MGAENVGNRRPHSKESGVALTGTAIAREGSGGVVDIGGSEGAYLAHQLCTIWESSNYARLDHLPFLSVFPDLLTPVSFLLISGMMDRRSEIEQIKQKVRNQSTSKAGLIELSNDDGDVTGDGPMKNRSDTNSNGVSAFRSSVCLLIS